MELTQIHRIQEGDEAAFADLFHKYKNLVFKTAFMMLGNSNHSEDVLQEVFIKVYKSISTYQPYKGAFTSWLYRITVNNCLNRLRKHSPDTLSFEDTPSSSLIDNSPSPEKQKSIFLVVDGLSGLLPDCL